MNRPAPLDAVDTVINEVSSLEYILLGDLRDVLEEPPDDVTVRWLNAVVDALFDILSREIAMQDDGGYLREVLDCDPNWDRYVKRLASERRMIYQQLRTLRTDLRTSADHTEARLALRDSLRDWMMSLTAFHRHERRLVQTAFNLDVGTGD